MLLFSRTFRFHQHPERRSLQLLTGDEHQSEVGRRRLEQQIRRVEGERDRLVQAVARGGELGSLLNGLREREANLGQLGAEHEALRLRKQGVRPIDRRRVAAELRDLAKEWRNVLAAEPAHARLILMKLLVGRVSFTPMEGPKRWELRGQGTIAGLFQAILPLGMASPTGLGVEAENTGKSAGCSLR